LLKRLAAEAQHVASALAGEHAINNGDCVTRGQDETRMAKQNDTDITPRTTDPELARSTPLRPVVWMTSVLVWATVVALIARIPTWASVFLCTVTGISFLVFLVGYIHLFTSDRDALRAERWLRGAGGNVIVWKLGSAASTGRGSPNVYRT